MNTTQKVWEQEYDDKNLMTGTKPAKSFTGWVKHIIKQRNLRGKEHPLQGLRILDLGCGEGKNALYLAELGATVYGIEIARNAVETTRLRTQALQNTDDPLVGDVIVQQGSIGTRYDFVDNYFDAIIDVTSSNSLSEAERTVYLRESARVLQPDGQMFVRALCKDGDINAKQLLQQHPGIEFDTYQIPDWQQTERVFAESDIKNLYAEHFTIEQLTKETHYTTYVNRKYKRRFWLMYLEQPKK